MLPLGRAILAFSSLYAKLSLTGFWLCFTLYSSWKDGLFPTVSLVCLQEKVMSVICFVARVEF